MNEEKLWEWIKKVSEPDARAAALCWERWDSIAKPLDGLGKFEELIARIAGIQGTPEVELSRKAVVIMCGDNGVVREGVAQTASGTTASVAAAIAAGRSTVNALARRTGASVFAVDVGMCSEAPVPGVIYCRVAPGAENIAEGPAMSREQAARGILAGIKVAADLAADGYDILAAGEMGIGNTTPTAAVTAALTGQEPSAVTGRGAGLPDPALEKKVEAVRRALAVNAPDPADPLGILAGVGCYEIAGMTGLYLGGALTGKPVVADGAVSMAAAVLAGKLCPAAAGSILLSHAGKEPASRFLMELTGMEPVLRADMALGEGTGALMLFPLLDMALDLYRHGQRFSDLGIPPYQRY